MPKTNKEAFLEEIEFNEDFGPFEKGTKVKFNDGMKEILEFYLRNKEGWDKSDAQQVAERIKINVIVGENGTGKSRLAKLIEKEENRNKANFEFSNTVKFDDLEVILNNPSIFNWESVNNYFLDFFFGLEKQKIDYFLSTILMGFFGFKYHSSELILFLKENVSLNLNNVQDINQYLEFIKMIKEFVDLTKKELKEFMELKNRICYILMNISSEYTRVYYNYIKLTLTKKNNVDINSLNSFTSTISGIIDLLFNMNCPEYDVKIYLDRAKDLLVEIQKKLTIYENDDVKTKIGILKDNLVDAKGRFFASVGGLYFKFIYFKGKLPGGDIDLSFKDKNKRIINYHLRLTYKKNIFIFFKLFTEFNNLYLKGFKGKNYSYNFFSSGERAIIVRFIKIYTEIIKGIESGKKYFLILIDEPDLHLHLDWQRQYIHKLIDVFAEFLKENEDISLHFIIATHSPFILSDVPVENVILLQKGKNDGYTKVVTYDLKKEHKDFKNLKDFEDYTKKLKNKTFGANFVDLIRNGFFFDTKNLMGSFAEEMIDKIAQIEKDEIIKDKEVKDVSDIKKNIKEKIGDSFLRDNLLYFKKSKEND